MYFYDFFMTAFTFAFMSLGDFVFTACR